MSQEIQEQQFPIVMKNGLVHWVGVDTHQRVQQALASQLTHNFMKVAELGITLNTADISGVYTMEQYDDLAKIKQGMWQCPYKKWHKKKGECECQVDFYEQQKRARQEIENAKNNKVDTQEQRAEKQREWRKIGDELKAKGVLRKVKK